MEIKLILIGISEVLTEYGENEKPFQCPKWITFQIWIGIGQWDYYELFFWSNDWKEVRDCQESHALTNEDIKGKTDPTFFQYSFHLFFKSSLTLFPLFLCRFIGNFNNFWSWNGCHSEDAEIQSGQGLWVITTHCPCSVEMPVKVVIRTGLCYCR